MDAGSKYCLTVERASSGGYLVYEFAPHVMQGRQIHFACTKIEDALEFVRHALVPVGGPEPPRPID